MSLTEKTTHAEESVARLLSQFKGKTKLEGMVSAQADQTQDEETTFFDLLDRLNIDISVGAQLDGIGEIIGEDRKGKSDALYRIYLKARVLVNKSSGTAPQINEIADILIADAYAQTYREYYPAAWKIIVDDEFPTDIDAVAELLSETRAGGVHGFLEYTEVDDDETFTFADADVAQTDAERGFAEELQTNGNFNAWTGDDPDDWTVKWEFAPNREISEVGPTEGHGGAGTGAANIYSDSATIVAMKQTITTVIGETYSLSFDVTKRVDPSVRVLGNAGALFDESFVAVGSHLIGFTAIGTSTDIEFQNKTAADMTIDNVAVHGHGGFWAGVMEA